MRTLHLFLTLFLLAAPAGLPAQTPGSRPSHGTEPVRALPAIASSAEEAARPAAEGSRYLRPVTGWEEQESTFTARFTVPFAWINRQVLFRLENASCGYEVRVNDRPAGQCLDPSLPAEFNVTRLVKEGRNSVEIRLLDPNETAPIEGWRDDTAPAVGPACVMSPPTLHIRDVVVKSQHLDEGASAEVGIVVKSHALNPRRSIIHYELLTPGGSPVTGGKQEITLDMRREDTLRFRAMLADTLLWSPEHPVRCTLRLKTQHEGRFVEYLEVPVGFREVRVDAGVLHINGRAQQLRGQRVAGDLPAAELAALREQGINLVHPRCGSLRSGFYDDCDRLGLCVIAQAPVDSHRSGLSRKKGGNPSNDPRWQAHYIARAEHTYHTAQRHPSVIAFSIADQSANGICLYESYLALKRLGDSRPVLYPGHAGEWNSDRLLYDAAENGPGSR